MRERPILFSNPMVRAILSGEKSQTRRIMKPQPKDHDHSAFDAPWAVMPAAYYHTGDREWACKYCGEGIGMDGRSVYRCRYGQPGDRLWVRECWALLGNEDGHPINKAGELCSVRDAALIYRADAKVGAYGIHELSDGTHFEGRWTPSIHMPRWACRLVLEIVSVRVERLQDISEQDAEAEGCTSVAPVQWFEGMKPMADGSRVRQECRGVPPAEWTEVEPLSSHDPLARTARDDFRRLWFSINGADSWAANPWVWVIEFRRVQP